MRCFVIMPFGEKTDANNSITDFDKIYTYLIKPAVESAGVECLRCDEVAESGWIHSKMFDLIYRSEVAVVDITSLNPNVFYELGVRHTLTPRVTVILKRKGTEIPFNIQDFSIIEYDPQDIASYEESKKIIADFIKNGLKLGYVDSPVHNILKVKVDVEDVPIKGQEIFSYDVKGSRGVSISLVTGELQNIKRCAHVWVNSENVNMQMARHFERSVSAIVRYLGSKRDRAGQVVDDLISNELSTIVSASSSVPPGTVIVTSAGELEKSHGVKRIFHAASAIGMLGVGYTPIPNVEVCVRRSLEIVDSEEYAEEGIDSILFPLMGTGTAKGGLEETAHNLLSCAVSYIAENPTSNIRKILFVVRTDRELQACQRALQSISNVSVSGA